MRWTSRTRWTPITPISSPSSSLPKNLHSGRDLPVELICVHVRLVPPIGWDHAAVRLSRCVDDREDGVAV